MHNGWLLLPLQHHSTMNVRSCRHPNVRPTDPTPSSTSCTHYGCFRSSSLTETRQSIAFEFSSGSFCAVPISRCTLIAYGLGAGRGRDRVTHSRLEMCKPPDSISHDTFLFLSTGTLVIPSMPPISKVQAKQGTRRPGRRHGLQAHESSHHAAPLQTGCRRRCFHRLAPQSTNSGLPCVARPCDAGLVLSVGPSMHPNPRFTLSIAALTNPASPFSN